VWKRLGFYTNVAAANAEEPHGEPRLGLRNADEPQAIGELDQPIKK